MFHQGFCFHYASHYQVIMKDKSFRVDSKVPVGLGKNQIALHGCIDLDLISLGPQVSCSHICL